MKAAFVALLLWLAATPAQACRCAQQNLADYFDAAQEVVMGRLSGWKPVEGEEAQLALRVELVAPAYKTSTTAAGDTDDIRIYRTADNSAGCGLASSAGAVYLFFAEPGGIGEADAPLQVNSCSGSRIILPTDGSEPVGFQDVPARFVPQQLNGLAGMELLRTIAQHYPNPADISNDKLIGLLDVAGFSHVGHALLFEQPSREGAQPVRISSYTELETREVAYETPAAVVYAGSGGWSRLRRASGEFGWLPPDYAGSFFPYGELPVRRLAYLSLPWHGFLWPEAGAGLPYREAMPAGQREQAVEVLESTRIGNSLWFRIVLLAVSPCDGGETGSGSTGWIPAYRENGDPAVWYYSRGC